MFPLPISLSSLPFIPACCVHAEHSLDTSTDISDVLDEPIISCLQECSEEKEAEVGNLGES